MAGFIGQQKILRELAYILPLARDHRDPYNILFEARSGYGKTTLGMMLIRKVDTYQILIEEDANTIIRKINDTRTRSNFVDEVHIINNLELLYPLMDSGQYFMLFATNQSYDLPEAFKRRCIQMIFDRYTKYELMQIVRMYLPEYDLSDECVKEIVKASLDTPGNIKTLCSRLRSVFTGRGGFSLGELQDVLVNILNIVDGLDPRCREYLEVLERLGSASLESLAYVLGVSKDTVRIEVEGPLLHRGLIRITSKGRILNSSN